MSRDRDDTFDARQPTLTVKYGAVTRQHRPLDRDVMILGRAPGRDVGLDAPDVAPVHCVIVRARDGWHVRDCTGRSATRLNGQSVGDAALSDADVLQVGSFSFVLHLPPEHRPLPAGEPAPPVVRALRGAQQSRRRLAELALRLRGRMVDAATVAAERAEKQLAARQEELDRQAEELHALQRDMDARVADLKQTAQEVAADKRDLHEQRGRLEAERAETRAEAEAAVQALAEKEQAHLAAVHEASRLLDIRSRELSFFADGLRRLRFRLNDHEESLAGRWEEWLREQQEEANAYARRGEKIVREEATLREQRAEVVRLMGEMRLMHQQPDLDAEALREEVERLRRDLTAAQREAGRRTAEANQLRAEQERAPAEQDPPNPAAGLERFRVELDAGRRVLHEQIREIQGRFADLERAACEAEANIAGERTRIVRERVELERLHGDLWPGDGGGFGGETLGDTPSPLRHLSEVVAAADER